MKAEKILEKTIYYLIMIVVVVYWIVFINCLLFVLNFFYQLIKSMVIEYKAVKAEKLQQAETMPALPEEPLPEEPMPEPEPEPELEPEEPKPAHKPKPKPAHKKKKRKKRKKH